MSSWCVINGIIDVFVCARTQPEAQYIIETIVSHLPKVTGSEGNMNIYIIQKKGFTLINNENEFGIPLKKNDFKIQNEYMLVLNGNLRDKIFDETFKELNIFLNRLAKRLLVNNIIISLYDFDKKYIFNNKKMYNEMYECPSWSNENGEPAWWEYLMWDRGIDTWMPMSLERKYYNNPKNDEEWDRRQKVMKENN